MHSNTWRFFFCVTNHLENSAEFAKVLFFFVYVTWCIHCMRINTHAFFLANVVFHSSTNRRGQLIIIYSFHATYQFFSVTRNATKMLPNNLFHEKNNRIFKKCLHDNFTFFNFGPDFKRNFIYSFENLKNL